MKANSCFQLLENNSGASRKRRSPSSNLHNHYLNSTKIRINVVEFGDSPEDCGFPSNKILRIDTETIFKLIYRIGIHRTLPSCNM